MTGLFCSSGEGIRLFPFPSTERAAVSASGPVFAGSDFFQFGVHRFEKSEGACSVKFHKRFTEKSADGEVSPDLRLRTGIAQSSPTIVNESDFATSSASFSMPSGRAPPGSDPQNS